jgi:hypothetical protein
MDVTVSHNPTITGSRSGRDICTSSSRAILVSRIADDSRSVTSPSLLRARFCNAWHRHDEHFPKLSRKHLKTGKSDDIPHDSGEIATADTAAPRVLNGKVGNIVPPRRGTNRAQASREHLTPQVDKLMPEGRGAWVRTEDGCASCPSRTDGRRPHVARDGPPPGSLVVPRLRALRDSEMQAEWASFVVRLAAGVQPL